MRPATEHLKKTDRVWVYLTREERQKLKAAAKADDRSEANWLRHFVVQSFESSGVARAAREAPAGSEAVRRRV